MKNFTYLMSAFLTAVIISMPSVSSAQGSQQVEKCLTDVIYKQEIKSNPEYLKNQNSLEAFTDDFVPRYLNDRKNRNSQKGAAVVKTIPVVFHIIHEGGPENISISQLENQIEIMNQDFRRLNADTSSTPAVFQPIAADSEIEFKLATKDPNGNCTDGVVRVFSSLTNNARNNVKALSYWPSNKYFNIWVVKTIENSNGGGGFVIGFAQFPGGNPLTDGVVLRHDFTGKIGTAGGNNAGRAAIHEIGHWLNLRHIWGDATCGNDFVIDTPPQQGPNQSNCPTWPKISCNNGPNGEMFTNYMDYTRGNCQNIFSNGQGARMNAALSSSISGRNNLWSSANLIATGTDPGAVISLCAPTSAFNDENQTICEGTSINFQDGSWNGAPASWSWDFPGGTPSTSTNQNENVTYNTAGVYDVSLTVTNATGSDTHTATSVITVLPGVGTRGIPYYESFETIAFPGTEWGIENEIGNTWEQSTLAAKTGITSVYINNYSGNPAGVDAFITPPFNFSWSSSHSLTFELAHAIRSTQSTDQLRVLVSTNCGQVWSIRYNRLGSALATAGLVSTPFFPSANQWATQTVNILSNSYNNKPNVKFKFEYTQSTGNNIFIDDILLDGTVGIDEALAESLDMNIYPNPVKTSATLNFKLDGTYAVYIDVLDVMGRVVNKIAEATFTAGEYQFELPYDLPNGLYNVRIFVDGKSISRKVMINR
jgi:PKD repeat protein